MKKTFVLAAVTVLAPGVLAACGGSKKVDGNAAETKAASSGKTTFRIMDEIKKSGVIRVGMFMDKAPFGYVDANGVNQGYDVAYAQRIAQDLGVKVEFTSLDPAARVEYVNTGKVDITLANFMVMKERAEQVDFAKPCMKVALGIVSPEKVVTHSVDELKGKTLIITKGITAETYFEKNYPEMKLQKYDAYADAYNVLLDGRGDAFLTDNTEVVAWAKASPGLEVGTDSLDDYDTIAAVATKGNGMLLNFLNEEIVTLDKKNFFHKDCDGTLKPVFGDATDPDAIVVEGGELGDIKQ